MRWMCSAMDMGKVAGMVQFCHIFMFFGPVDARLLQFVVVTGFPVYERAAYVRHQSL